MTDDRDDDDLEARRERANELRREIEEAAKGRRPASPREFTERAAREERAGSDER